MKTVTIDGTPVPIAISVGGQILHISVGDRVSLLNPIKVDLLIACLEILRKEMKHE